MPPTNADDPLRTAHPDPIAAMSDRDHTAASPSPAHDIYATRAPERGTEPGDSEPLLVPASVSVPGYEIETVLGRGSMGVVYKARHLALKRTVALKMVLAGGHAGPRELARFRIEAELVARLQHPNIVQIHEVGEADGHPYCALEFVDGGNLASKIDGKPMPAREAARLVESLARAMQLAHSRNVVHRDLKPANILLSPLPLVGERSGVKGLGTPKITDFGLARQLDRDSSETKAGTVIGTPSYMAPEQASGRAHEAGPPADVYALGAILYECLAGRPPFKGETVVDTIDLVRTQEAVPPSRWQADVPLDLDTVCLRCLRKEPESRYASAAELADELVRYQQGEPILARPAGRIERAVKWVKRNPLLTGAMVIVVLALTVGTTVSYLKYRDAEQQRGIAEDSRKDAQKQQKEAEKQTALAKDRQDEADQVSQFLAGLFEDANPIARTGRMFGAQNRGQGALTALEVIDRGAAHLKTALTDKPRVRAVLLDRIGNVYVDLGRPQAAKPLLQEALQIRTQEFGADHLEVASSLQSLGLLHLSLGELELAGQELNRALALRRKHLDGNDPLLADTLFHLGVQRLLIAEYAEAERWLLECQAVRRNHFGNENREVAAVLFVLGTMYCVDEQFAKAAPLLTEAAAIADKLEGKEGFTAILSLFTRAQLAESLGNAKQARALFEEADAKAVRLLGDDHYILSFGRRMFGDFLTRQGDHEAAAKVIRRVVVNFRKSFGPNSFALTGAQLTLARAERESANFKAAEDAAREGVRLYRKRDSQRPLDLKNNAACLHVLAALIYNRGARPEAETFYREGLAILLRPEVGEDGRTQGMARDLARLLLEGEHLPVSPEFSTHTKVTGKPDVDFVLAQTWARAAQVLTRHPLPPPANDERILEHFQKQAVLMLRSAVASGLRDAKAIEANADLKPLHARHDFKELLRELAKKTFDK